MSVEECVLYGVDIVIHFIPERVEIKHLYFRHFDLVIIEKDDYQEQCDQLVLLVKLKDFHNEINNFCEYICSHKYFIMIMQNKILNLRQNDSFTPFYL